MTPTLRTINIYCMIIGMILLVTGFFTLTNPPFLGLFTSNELHAVLHILLGIMGIWTGLRGGAYGFSVFLGIFLLSVGGLYFLPVVGTIIKDLLKVNTPVAWLDILFGMVSLLVSFLGRKLSKTFSVQ